MPVTSYIDRLKHNLSTRTGLVLVTVSILTAIILFSGCGDGTSAKPAVDVGTGPATVKAKDPISREAVEKVVSRKLGDTAAAGQPMIRSLTLTPEANGQFVNIDLNRTSSCHPGALTGTTVTISQQVMAALFLYPDVSRVQVTIYGTTDASADKDKPATTVMVDKATASKIDWFQFTDANVEKLATSFWADPVVYRNWKQYGGAELTDEAQKAAANAAATGAAAVNTANGTSTTP